jgi:hypothetical protein
MRDDTAREMRPALEEKFDLRERSSGNRVSASLNWSR